MNKANLLLGTNIGNREEALLLASQLVAVNAGVIVRKSSIYETAPWGNREQASFLNQALMINTEFNAHELLKIILQIEAKMGRQRIQKWEARVIDIDILFYNSEIINDTELTIPHPFIRERRFALVPLNELMPSFIHPVYQCSVNELLQSCTDTEQVKLYI